jgi:hypothetical protein
MAIRRDLRFVPVHLSFNLGVPMLDGLGRCQEGSSACSPRTECGGVSNDCQGASDHQQLGFDARILVALDDLPALHDQLHAIVKRVLG